MVGSVSSQRDASAPEAIRIPFEQSSVLRLREYLDEGTASPDIFSTIIPQSYVIDILDSLEKIVKKEPTLLQVQPPKSARVIVVGDTHGQYHDVRKMMVLMGDPSPTNIYVFNGDYVDRGAWGLETLLLIAAWKICLPGSIYLLRGNHETSLCSMVYGFKGELVAKFGTPHWKLVYGICKKTFSSLPLAAVVAKNTLILHGGLFRKPRARARGKHPKRKRPEADEAIELGNLEDLAASSKGGLDPSGAGSSALATDVLWSDPVIEPGLEPNYSRNVGVVFGPDVTERFLRENDLRLILRSHEGPDAREGRTDMGPMSDGYTLDHETSAGNLMTVFSAPDYPQFMHEGIPRYRNKGCVAVLSEPYFCSPEMVKYEAAPRPKAHPYYDLGIPDSDEELDPVASDVSGMTDVRAELNGTLDDADSIHKK